MSRAFDPNKCLAALEVVSTQVAHLRDVLGHNGISTNRMFVEMGQISDRDIQLGLDGINDIISTIEARIILHAHRAGLVTLSANPPASG